MATYHAGLDPCLQHAGAGSGIQYYTVLPDPLYVDVAAPHLAGFLIDSLVV